MTANPPRRARDRVEREIDQLERRIRTLELRLDEITLHPITTLDNMRITCPHGAGPSETCGSCG